ncbi:anti-sigma-factor antagonist [Caldicellulosiruptor owensensis OL]|uniref:Anti-sigma-factor antagonist n=1 Tax=Caldicellulosiruptor owensensis (strain ATCC 700167 / DSM 13100 / OL) TaxID=632518 RepID=E4Q3W9_CALOW|nr:STAS domain-containing protein [Caldicellulosiruptor owensensis]ADQ04004.1 anti-sigma-factor antagonist [Caldicellulosiruptor owensensis OL]
MKEKIIKNLDKYVDLIETFEVIKESWKEFLITIAEFWNTDDFEKKTESSLEKFIELIDNTILLRALETIKSEIKEFPIESILKIICKVSAKLLEEKKLVIRELKDALAELATPTIRVWKDVILVPLIGALDSERAQNAAERVLEFASNSRAKVVIIDVTGIPMIDTIVGGFLIEMFNAIKLLGCEVVLTGIKPNIAHTLVKLGIDFNMVTVKRDLESGLRYAISVTEQNK